jgi:hypothetical protein
MGEQWNDTDSRTRITLWKSCPTATLSTADPTAPTWAVTQAAAVASTRLAAQVLTRSVRYMYIKVKQSRYTPWRHLRGEEYRSLFTTSALYGGEWLASRPGRALPLGKGPPVSIGQESGWAPEPVWTQRTEEISFAPAGDLTPIARSSSP